jgi:predicted outer membrane lipoprotein
MMKNLSWRMGLAAACAALTMFGRTAPVFAAEEDRGGPADRLERLERRVNEMAQQQEQLMRRLGAQRDRRGPMAAAGRENFRPPMALRGREGIGQPMLPAAAPALARAPASPGAPAPVAPHLEAAKSRKDIAGLVMLLFLVAFAFNILVAVWIHTDIRKRGEGSGIFIALAVLAGIPAAIIYSLVRIGDKKT